MISQKNNQPLKNIFISASPAQSGELAERNAAGLIREAIAVNGQANIILATGATQFETSNPLIQHHEDCRFYLDEASASLLTSEVGSH